MRWCILIACLFAAGCNFSLVSDVGYASGGIDTITAVETNQIDHSASSSCYKWMGNGDTALLQLAVRDEKVTGTLSFNYAKKENITGILKGVVDNGVINLDYTYKEKGKTVIKETIFKVEGDVLVKASGELKDTGEKIKYVNNKELKFNKDRSFNKVDCIN